MTEVFLWYMEHCEVTVGTLRLPSVTSQHHILRTIARSDDTRPVEAYLHPIGLDMNH